ncbi:M16 family metallopeptidase [Parapusillimonas granuli]|uniref:Insulinase family protein n=1 Tax=Parapusillimonas granuli TaxID=380911 RepID=A0A853G073_9BURK|nr:pitrilysin family protein [Parapusillimonas granuli]MBB5214970.1 zinc protease [Parapusillimonas granuli]NYT49292.1 insulinase family protein [Parapusillimonas granuli]
MLAFLSRTVFYAGALLLSTTLVFSARAVDLPAGVSEIASVEGVTEYTLPNGLRILLAPDDSKPTTTANMTYKVGSRHENYGQTGMAHLLEHLLFRGTPTLRNALAEFSKRGLAANGSTNSDRTNYYASFAADPDNLDWYLRWQADAMVNSLIAREDLDSEMTVVRNEMERGENNPFQVLLQRMQAVAFQWHNYGKSTIGARSDVENVDIAQLQAFYRTYYQPDNAVLIVSGRFDPATVLAIASDAFGKIPRPERSLPPEYTEEPVQDGERKVVLRRQGGSPLIAALFHAPAAADPDFVALNMGASILADTPSGRLYHALVGNGLSSSVFGFASGQRQPGYVFFGAQLEEGMDQDKALAVMNETLDSVAKQPFKQDELDRIRNRWLTNWSRTYANPAGLASALSESVGDGDWRLFFLQRDRVESVKLDDVQRVTAAYLLPSNRTNGMYVPGESPQRAPRPGAVDLDAALKDYRGKDTGAAATAFDPTPANIDATTDRAPLELANGPVKLALLSKPTRGDRVEAKLLVQFGNVDSLKGMRTISEATAALLAHGTRSMTRQEIEDRYNALQADVDFGGGAGVVAVSMSTTGENLPEVIKLSLHILREASFPAKELTEYQRQVGTAIRNAMAEPGSLASRALARHDNPWPRDDVRYTPTFEEELAAVAALTPGQLEQFHSRFYGAGTVAFSAVGQFDAQAVKTALRGGLDGWRKAPAYTRVPDPYHDVPPQEFLINTPDKANAFYLAALPLKLQDTDEDYAALYLANYLLGSSETSRLWTRIRVQDGLSYDVRSMLDASSFEPSGSWSFYAIHAPENTQRLRAAMAAELERVVKDGFTEDEVREGITALLNFRKLARTRDGALASTWINYMQLDRSFEWSAHIDQALSGLTAQTVSQAVRKRLDPARLSVAIAADQAKQQ